MVKKQEYKSIMPDDVKGVTFGWGLSGVGKSWLLGRAENPNLSCYIDFDDGKGEQLHSMFHYAKYVDVKAQAAKKFPGMFHKPKHLYEYLAELFDDIEKDRFTYCFIDNVSPLEKALNTEVKRDPDGYGIGKNKMGVSNAVTGAFGGASPAVQDLVSDLVNILHGKGIRLVGASAHFGAQWSGGGPIPNKYEAKGVERWHQMSILSMVVIPSGNKKPFPPAATVQKEALGEGKWDETLGKYTDARRRLPLRLPEATFEAIYYYLEHPADIENPAPGEVPTADEIDPYNKRFSKDQLEYMKLAAQIELKKESDSFMPGGNGHNGLTDEHKQFAKELSAAGDSPKVIKAKLLETFGVSVETSQVVEVIQ